MSDASLPSNNQKELETAFAYLTAVNYHVLASTVMLLYDHILTFEQERMYIWNQRKSLPSLVFLFFRYFCPVVSIINLVAEHDPGWSDTVCRNWIWLPVSTGTIINAATGVILIMRVHAIYCRARWILYVTVPVYLAELGVMMWSIPSGIPATNLPPGFVGCFPIPKPGTGLRLTSIYIAALGFDTVVFSLTFMRAFYRRFTKEKSVTLLRIIVRDGTLYYTVIFVVNLINVFLLALAPPDISAINAPFASMITTVLVSRLVLNLREAAAKKHIFYNSVTLDTMTFGTVDPTQSYNPPSTLVFNKPVQHANAIVSFIGLDEFDFPLDDLNHEVDTRRIPDMMR
ncbi:hypothetical protein JOM56_000973 [Amanita muscaria]